MIAKKLSTIYVEGVLEFLRTRKNANPMQGQRNAILDYTGIQNEFNHPWCDDWARFVNEYIGKKLRDPNEGSIASNEAGNVLLKDIIVVERYYWTKDGREHNYNGIRPSGYIPENSLSKDNGIVLLDPWITLLPIAYWPSKHPAPPSGRGINPLK